MLVATAHVLPVGRSLLRLRFYSQPSLRRTTLSIDYSRTAVPDIKRQLKALEKRRGLDPDIPAAFVDGPRFYVAYYWEDASKRHVDGRWILIGFVMALRLQFPKIRQIRLNFKLPEHRIMKLMDLFLAAKRGGPGDPPSQYNPVSSRKWLAQGLRGRT